jgi:ribosomal protein S18 acetylase RimI-like enzyme
MTFEMRLAMADDKPRILEISAQIWEGEDYIPLVVDRWLAARGSELIVALLDGELVAFAHLQWFAPDYVWMEGIRTDPARRNLGAGKALTEYLVARARQEGALRAGLSTYIDNSASIRIIETHGFRRVAGFVYLEAGPESPARAAAEPSDLVEDVPADEAAAFVAGSRFLAAAQGYFPQGWKYYPFSLGPEVALGHVGQMLGIRRAGRLAALLCVGRSYRSEDEFCVDFLDGDEAGCELLLRHALHLARSRRMLQAPVPKWAGQAAPALALFRRLGFAAWNDFEVDVFVYEREL